MTLFKRLRDTFLVVVLLALPFFFLRASIRKPEELNAVDRAMLRIAAPLQFAAAAVSRAVSNVVSQYVYLVDVKTDNDRLVYENARLRATQHELAAQLAENRRLRRLLGLRDTIQHETVSALVVGKDATEYFRVWHLTVDAPNGQLRPNMPVISLEGAVGTVLRVAGSEVDVQLTVDSGFGVDVVVKRSGARGFVRGSGDRAKYAVRVEYVQRTDQVEVGDLLETSGVGCRFPKGIPIARVTKVLRRDFGIYQTVEAVPTVDFSRLEEVLVILVDTSECETEHVVPGSTPAGGEVAMRSAAYLGLAIFLILIQSNLYRIIGPIGALVGPRWVHGITPSLVLPLVVFLGVHELSMARGALLAFAIGYAEDVLSGAPIGLFTFGSVALWWLARVAGVRLTAQTALPRMSLAFAFSLVEGAMVLILLAIFGDDTRRPIEVGSVVVPRALATALCSPPIFRLAQRLRQGPVPLRPVEGS